MPAMCLSPTLGHARPARCTITSPSSSSLPQSLTLRKSPVLAPQVPAPGAGKARGPLREVCREEAAGSRDKPQAPCPCLQRAMDTPELWQRATIHGSVCSPAVPLDLSRPDAVLLPEST